MVFEFLNLLRDSMGKRHERLGDRVEGRLKLLQAFKCHDARTPLVPVGGNEKQVALVKTRPTSCCRVVLGR